MIELIHEMSRVMDCATAFQWKKLSSSPHVSRSAFQLVSLPAFIVTWTPGFIYLQQRFGLAETASI
jgi:hypothetical protein